MIARGAALAHRGCAGGAADAERRLSASAERAAAAAHSASATEAPAALPRWCEA